MKRIPIYFVSVVGFIWIFALVGCQETTVVTTAGPSSSGAIEGMLYYLPIGKITIKGEYTTSEQSPAPTATATPSPTPTPTTPTQATRNGKQDGNPTDSDGGAITISGGQLKITVTSRVEADQKAGVYYVTPQTNDIFEDEVQVTVNSKHLLSAGKVTTEDKTAEIAGTLASFAATVAKLAPAKENRVPFYFSFDPSNRNQVGFVIAQLRQRGVGLTVTTDAAGRPLDTPTVKATAVQLGKSGLVFRPAAAYNIQLIYPVDARNGSLPPTYIIKNTEQFILPDRTRLCVMKYDRMAFVKKVREVGFSDGMLTDFHQKRPSPILGFLGIPKAILQAIVPIPGAASPSGSASASGTGAPQN
jgi:hypothetical protein